ncbi:uncharacterized protein Z520_10733 [Fonsecaea multimorphosa CBS 102226]|uniref:Uncharacterized protein n=1 Tax=Fonsecaea multimorphosa CBS 102226 TaxID=1442371 RepID=A0A0D2GVD9_9EURO|nr:uncharacterized protein Z520_10733 [Fonsecaea multimorphosa CBS 102226]KIX93555.1 hypothetical protein Z520_10733 [Fonsecaea multimorphosa CBS 102226]OAL18870.1 hypothetical protein AYO22_10199 [Fonsecaea multimorphosa]
MEARLRKLLSPRRHKAQRRNDAAPELDLHSVPYTTAPPQSRIPLFNKSSGVTAKQSKVNPPPDRLRSLSYDEAAPGKPPELGDRPHRGNGPVKLQTSRRLSSGELLVTEQDYDRTLEDIKQGEYIVGGKERRTSHTSSQQKSSTEPPHAKFISTAPNSPRDQVFFSSPIWQPPSVLSDMAPPTSSSWASSSFGPQERSQSAQEFHSHVLSPGSSHHGLGISSPAQSFFSPYMASTTSLLEPHEEQNPTIQALWKAEYGRLVSIYGQAGVDRTIGELNRDRAQALGPPPLLSTRDSPYSASSMSLSQIIQRPPESVRRGLGIKASGSTPNLDLAYMDEHSDRSSHARYSHLSSSGASSSFTTRTSIAEDPSISRDDIRKIVDEMRTTYLHAIEAHTPTKPLPDVPVKKSRSKKQTPSLVSYASVDSSLRSASRQSTTRTKSWQSSTTLTTTPRTSVSSPVIRSKRTSSATSRRTSGQPVAGIATLPAIQASPAKSHRSGTRKQNDGDVGLKRADSTTLGVMARKLTILDDRQSSTSSQPTVGSPPTIYNSSRSGSDSCSEESRPSVSPPLSPAKPSSVQHTPEKHKPAIREISPLSKQSWQIDVDQILPDEELELALDIDDFEALCDGLFNTPAMEAEPQFNVLRTWSGDGKAEDGDDVLGSDDGDTIAIDSPTLLKMPPVSIDQRGLSLTGLPTMI